MQLLTQVQLKKPHVREDAGLEKSAFVSVEIHVILVVEFFVMQPAMTIELFHCLPIAIEG
jgi:hypothetical protein